MRVSVKIRILDRKGGAFLGPGPVELLRRTGRCGSVHRAAAEMGMSYMKALRLVKAMEAGAGGRLVLRRAGGRGGGGSELTDLAGRLIDAFAKLEAAVSGFAEKEFARNLGCRILRRRGEA